MKIKVTDTPEVNMPCATLLLLLCLEVDTSYPEDGYYHIRVEEVLRALRAERFHHWADCWQGVFRQREMIHLLIPAGCCEELNEAVHT